MTATPNNGRNASYVWLRIMSPPFVRSGIMSVDEGQFEAGRSLGLNYTQTMRLIILPQAFKNVLPALANEFITLLKETSISGYIATTSPCEIVVDILFNTLT